MKLTDDGRVEIVIRGQLRENQKFKVSVKGLSDIKVEGGTLKGEEWLLNPHENAKTASYKFSARLVGGLVARQMVGREEDWSEQPLVTNKNQSGRKTMELPAGYSFENWESPRDLYGRPQLFEPTGIAVAKDGTIVVATRSAGVWRIRNGKWSLFAEGTYEALGVWIEDDKGDKFVVMQKPELTRISDTTGDGRADLFETVCDDYGFLSLIHI